jgi:hypothetical protein
VASLQPQHTRSNQPDSIIRAIWLRCRRITGEKQVSGKYADKEVDMIYLNVFNPCNIQSCFNIFGLWSVNADIFRDVENLTICITDRPDPAGQLTVPETHRTLNTKRKWIPSCVGNQ